MLEFLKILFLGVVQGFTEPLPISSSGHLVIFETLLNYNPSGISFEALINFGSTVAIIIFFWDDLKELLFGLYNYFLTYLNSSKNIIQERKKYLSSYDYVIKIIIATIPLVIVGFLIQFFHIEFGDSIEVTAVALIVTAGALFSVYKLHGDKKITNMTYKEAFMIGLFQAIAFLPGLSRSGMTLVGLLLLGFANKEAFKFSFIMYIPASFGALLFSIVGLFLNYPSTSVFIQYLMSGILAGIFTFVGLKVLQKTLQKSKLNYFSIYCLIVGIIILVL